VFGGGSIQLLRISGIRIGASPSWFIVLFVLIYFLSGYFQDTLGGSQTEGFIVAVCSVLLFFASLILHELGHALVARRGGIEIDGIDLWLLGGLARFRQDTRSPRQEFAVAAAGPAVSLVIAIVFALLSLAVAGADDAVDVGLLRDGVSISAPLALLVFLAEMNLWLFVFNLLPAFPLDGGRIARAVVWKLTGDRNRATRTSAAIGQFAGYALIAFGLWRAIDGEGIGGLWWALIGWFIASAARSAVVSTAFTERLEGITVADVMDPSPVSMPDATPVGRAEEEYFLRYRWDWFPVVDDQGRFLGLVRHDAVAQAAAAGGVERPVRDVIDEDPAQWRVAAEEPIEALLGSERLRRLGALMAVDRNGVLTGVVTFEQVRRAVAAAFPAR
jgi:Zn-dependent protease/CBS domain-containing protein